MFVWKKTKNITTFLSFVLFYGLFFSCGIRPQKDTYDDYLTVLPSHVKWVKNKKSPDCLPTGFYLISKNREDEKRELDRTRVPYRVPKTPFLDASHFVEIEVQEHEDATRVLTITLDDIGKKIMKDITTNQADERVGVVLNDVLLFVAKIRKPVDNGIVEILDIKKYSVDDLKVIRFLTLQRN